MHHRTKHTCMSYRLLTGMLLLCLSTVFVRAQHPVRGEWVKQGDSLVLRTYSKQKFIAAGQLTDAEKERLLQSGASKSFLKVKGNLRYEFLYRSYADTPFALNHLRQHTVQSNLEVTVKDRYPFRINLAARVSNSPYFRNFLDMNLLFDRQQFNRRYKEWLLDKVNRQFTDIPDIKSLETALRAEKDRLEQLRNRLAQPDIKARIVAERERQFQDWESKRQKGVSVDSLSVLSKTDSLRLSFADTVKTKREELTELQGRVKKLEQQLDSTRRKWAGHLAGVRKKIMAATNPQELKRIAAEEGISERQKEKAEKILSNIRSIGIGRSLLNYSELTAMNVSLTGLNVEYGSRIYTALAVGKVDYGFRDFMGRNLLQKSQQLLMGRVGLGDPDRLAVIVSGFTGRKSVYGSIPNDSVKNHVNILGYSVEGIWKKDGHTQVVAEIAKSTGPSTGSFKQNKEVQRLFRFSDERNMAVSLKAQTYIPVSRTRLSGYFRKSGEHFQSFSLFTYNTDQLAWSARADQSFWKDQLGLMLQLRRNDFTNPFTEKTFKTSTVFTSMQLQLRIKKWPTLTAGYYPGTQLYMIDKERIRENAYYILNGSVVYAWQAGKLRMLSSAIYNRFESKATDTGFIAYAGINYMAVQSIQAGKFNWQLSYSYTDQPELKYSTLEYNMEWVPFKALRLGAGCKYNRLATGQVYWGERAAISAGIGKLGTLQLQYDKSYLPTIRRDLFAIETGRITWFKNF